MERSPKISVHLPTNVHLTLKEFCKSQGQTIAGWSRSVLLAELQSQGINVAQRKGRHKGYKNLYPLFEEDGE